jgi:hypothetical protein
VSDATIPTADSDDQVDGNALMSRLRVIEDQPLGDRAQAYAQVYDELQAALEGGDQAPRR